MAECDLCLKREATAEVEGMSVCWKCATKVKKNWKYYRRKWEEATGDARK